MKNANDKTHITFSFGENWRDFVGTVSEETITRALQDIEDWVGRESIENRTVLDVGCGSGIHSLCFHRLGARQLTSFDLDPKSVESTQILHTKANSPENWRLLQGSVLDLDFMAQIEQHDIVYSWGVLHHTGSMWEALGNVCEKVKDEGLLWIALYVAGPLYPKHLEIKKRYNRASPLIKKRMIYREIAKYMYHRLRARQNPFGWNMKKERGMNVYHDIVDWLGGLPYEVASTDEVKAFCEARGFTLQKVVESPEGGNNIYLLKKVAN